MSQGRGKRRFHGPVGYRLCSGFRRWTAKLRGWRGRRFPGPVRHRLRSGLRQWTRPVFFRTGSLSVAFWPSVADCQVPGLARPAFRASTEAVWPRSGARVGIAVPDPVCPPLLRRLP